MKLLLNWALGILSLVPLCYFFLFLTVFLLTLFQHGEDTPLGNWVTSNFPIIFTVHVGIALLALVLTVIFVVDVFSNPSLPDVKRQLWLILILLFGIVGMPAYWYLYMRPKTGRKNESNLVQER